MTFSEIQHDIEVIETKLKRCEENKRDIETRIAKLRSYSHGLCCLPRLPSDSSSLISILLESERILSMLSIPDLLSLYSLCLSFLCSACVNSHCHRLIRQESVWESLLQGFPSESIEQINNPWIRHQWARLHSDAPKEAPRSV